MSIPEWPSNLPQELLVAGYGEQPGRNVIKSQTDVGPAKLRRRGSCAPREIKGTIRLSPEELDTFDEFYETTLMSGVLRFAWVHPIKQDDSVEMRFTDRPVISTQGLMYDVSLSLEILP